MVYTARTEGTGELEGYSCLQTRETAWRHRELSKHPSLGTGTGSVWFVLYIAPTSGWSLQPRGIQLVGTDGREARTAGEEGARSPRERKG